MDPTIRAATAADAPAVKHCIDAAFALYVERIGGPPGPMLLDIPAEIARHHVWLAEADGDVVGALVQYDTEHGFYIDTVAALPRVQGMGVGRALLMFAEAEAMRREHRSVYLCTNAHMTENQRFYPRIGYVEYDRGFDSGFDRVFYRKPLPGSQE